MSDLKKLIVITLNTLLVFALIVSATIVANAGVYTYPITNASQGDGLGVAFPGAEGFAKWTCGGRGGEVYYVTRNDDCSDANLVPGTLRWALRHDNGGKPRTVLFATSGVIFLTSKLNLAYDDVSILGQSAPGGGITIAGYKLYICKNNVIVRYIRFRAGDAIDTNMTSLDIENCKNVIIDHCSLTWSMEECMTAYDTDYTTVQYCIIGEGLYNSKHDKGARAYAMQWGGEHSTLHHCLVTNSVNRTPLFNGVRSKSNKRGEHDYQVDSEYANNVIFNFGKSNSSHGGANYGKQSATATSYIPTIDGYDPPYNRLAVINNTYIPGPATAKGCTSARYMVYADSYAGEYWLSGNKFDIPSDFALTSGIWASDVIAAANADNMANVGNENGVLGAQDKTYELSNVQPESTKSGLVYETADESKNTTLDNCGARLPRIDEVDVRIIKEAKGEIAPVAKSTFGALGIIDSPSDIKLDKTTAYAVGAVVYLDYPSAWQDGDKYIKDSNLDGIPDGCEATNLEDYLNGIVDGTYNKSLYETENSFVSEGWTMREMPSETPAKPSDETYKYTFYGYELAGKVYKVGETAYAPSDAEIHAVYTTEPTDIVKGSAHTTADGGETYTWQMRNAYNTTDTWNPDFLLNNDLADMESSVISVGSGVNVNGESGIKNMATVFQPITKSSSLDENAYVCFTLQPSSNIKFKITKISFSALMSGGSCSLESRLQIGDDEQTVLSSGAKINGANNVFTDYSFDTTSGKLPTEYSGDPINLYVYFFNTGEAKGMGIKDVKIEVLWQDETQVSTVIKNINTETPQECGKTRNGKCVIDGRLVIVRDGKKYNLAGVRIK